MWSNSKIKKIALKFNDYFSVGIVGPKICVGYVGTDLYRHPCPAHEKINGGTQCKLCYQLDVNAVCSRCTGSGCDASSELQSRCINTPTIVYIAGFKSGVLKVGVTRESRGLSRWLEQGADFAVRLTTCPDGLKARKIEDFISSNFGITKVVRRNKKKFFNSTQYSFEWFKHELHKLFSKVRELFGCKISLDNIFNFEPFYGKNISVSPTEINIPRDLSDEIRVLGNIVAVKGSFVVLQYEKSHYLIDFSKAYGYHLNWQSQVAMKVQSSLEDFF